MRRPPDVATPFGLVIHELGTNAAKYGAFSVDSGRVTLKWTVSGNDPTRLTIEWAESGGPPVSPPEKRGSAALIENGLPRSTVRRTFAREGVVCTIEFDRPRAPHDGAAR